MYLSDLRCLLLPRALPPATNVSRVIVHMRMLTLARCAAGGNVGLESFAMGGHPSIGMGRQERRQQDARDEKAK
jgi:hypothetical protein